MNFGGILRGLGLAMIVGSSGIAYATSPHIVNGSGVIHDYLGNCATLASSSFTGCSVSIGLASTDLDTDASRGLFLAEKGNGLEGPVCLLGSQSDAEVSLDSSGTVASLSYGFGTSDVGCSQLPGRYVSIRDTAGGYWAVYLSNDLFDDFKFGPLDDSQHPWMACSGTDSFSRSTGCSPVDDVIVGSGGPGKPIAVPMFSLWALGGLSGLLVVLGVARSRAS